MHFLISIASNLVLAEKMFLSELFDFFIVKKLLAGMF